MKNCSLRDNSQTFRGDDENIATSALRFHIAPKEWGKLKRRKSGTSGEMASCLFKWTDTSRAGRHVATIWFFLFFFKQKHKTKTNKVFNTYLKYSGYLIVGIDMVRGEIKKLEGALWQKFRILRSNPTFQKTEQCASESYEEEESLVSAYTGGSRAWGRRGLCWACEVAVESALRPG